MGMTDDKIRQLLNGYETKLLSLQPLDTLPDYPHCRAKLDHVIEMIPKMRKFLDEGRREKVFRWLGFLQCVFWMLDIYRVEDLANHSRPTKDDLKEQYPRHTFDINDCPGECGWGSGCKVPCKYAKEYKEAPKDQFPIT